MTRLDGLFHCLITTFLMTRTLFSMGIFFFNLQFSTTLTDIFIKKKAQEKARPASTKDGVKFTRLVLLSVFTKHGVEIQRVPGHWTLGSC